MPARSSPARLHRPARNAVFTPPTRPSTLPAAPGTRLAKLSDCEAAPSHERPETTVERMAAAPIAAPTGSETDAPPAGSQRRRRTGLHTYLVGLVLLVLAPALLLGAATTCELGQAYRRAEEAGLTSTAQALATALDREVEIAATALSTLAASTSVASGDNAGSYGQAAAVGRALGAGSLASRQTRSRSSTRSCLSAPSCRRELAMLSSAGLSPPRVP